MKKKSLKKLGKVRNKISRKRILKV